MIQDGGEVYWNLAAMYRGECDPFEQVGMKINELHLRLEMLERKSDGG